MDALLHSGDRVCFVRPIELPDMIPVGRPAAIEERTVAGLPTMEAHSDVRYLTVQHCKLLGNHPWHIPL